VPTASGVEVQDFVAQRRALQEATSTTNSATKLTKLQCPEYTHLLYWGVTDKQTNGEVSRLQTYLKSWAGYTGKITGVFDEDTELAVRRLQKNQNLVRPGLSCQTGYGVVETKTRTFLNNNQSCVPVIPRKTVSCLGVAQCPDITKTLARGGADPEGSVGQVAMLQCFLRAQGVYSGPVNGSFGYSTQTSLMNWQKSRGFLRTGTTNEETRSGIARCAEQVAQPVQQERSEEFSLHVSPASGPAPLTIKASFALNGSSCTSYEVDWGDGTPTESFDAGRPDTCVPRPVTFSVNHVYQTPNTYTISVKHGQDSLSRLHVRNQAQVIVR
jgi:peptidoglycan hydrolase-like protein with peptidoglycan-binding domain